MIDRRSLEAEFDEAMWQVYEAVKHHVYNPQRFGNMIKTHGGVHTARYHLQDPTYVAEGFTRLWEAGCVHLSMEWMIVNNPRFHSLLTNEEIETARQRITPSGREC